MNCTRHKTTPGARDFPVLVYDTSGALQKAHNGERTQGQIRTKRKEGKDVYGERNTSHALMTPAWHEAL